MAPSLVETTTEPIVPIEEGKINLKGLQRVPLKSSGALDAFESFDVTPVIGREFPNASLKDFLRAPNSDELLRDLALTISQRGVVFFRKQDGLDDELQKELVQRLGELSGKPKTSGLHIHPIANSGREHSVADDEISVISSQQRKTLYIQRNERKQSARTEWHSDITFEPIPSDYTILRLTELPRTGGDTLWASGYEVYDRLSEPYQKFLEGLTATYAQPRFNEVAQNNNFKIHPGPRGAPENVGEELRAEHPVIRTNPVTGWKSVFAVGTHVQKVNGVTQEESDHLLKWFVNLIVENHDLQVRLRWQNPNDLAIWDNRSVYHAATWDYEEIGSRTGHRAVGLGERPYLDPKSISRRQALAESE
ncbi:putative alpha-ketoglutarate-dependent sulfonate dioxygenase [Penicillium brasilianum]|uniref:Putative alpha-ketoglutarate-dependent sulfonate dioxygenase n=1 Tax=Penicillium brasilianum TaxID=104259 RepID=A0A1S9RVI1_PENBI|nr:putative alpha-ketoglutarate-dependent sulfonate dioxygenase [Penicillium brasilianum]